MIFYGAANEYLLIASAKSSGEQKWAASVLREHGATVQQQTLVRWLAELGVQAPTLYWHVASKQVLLDQMATTMLRDLIASG